MESVIGSFDIISSLPMARWKIVMRHEDLTEFGFPCYLKVDVAGHKSEIGAIVRCDNLRDAEEKLRKMHKAFPNNKIIIQENAEGIEMIVGLKGDDVFGKLLVVGFGGIFAEVKKDVSFRALSVTRKDVVQMIKDLKGVEFFRARGKNYDMEKFVTLVEKVVYLADKIDIAELDLNPVIVGETDVKIVDARIELN